MYSRNVRAFDSLRYPRVPWSSLPIIGKSLGHQSQAATAIYSQLNLDPVRASVAAAVTKMIAASRKKPKRLRAG